MAKKKSFNYFKTFVKFADLSCAAADILDDVLRNFDPEILPEKLEELHCIEHEEDTLKHKMMEALAREFITPIEREDIAVLAQQLDDVTDAIEDILIKIYTYNILNIKQEALLFSKNIVKSSHALRKLMEELRNFKKSGKLMDSIIEINGLESEGDQIYNTSMRDLHVNSKDVLEILVWSNTFNCLEECCDCFEAVADIVENIVMKNS